MNQGSGNTEHLKVRGEHLGNDGEYIFHLAKVIFWVSLGHCHEGEHNSNDCHGDQDHDDVAHSLGSATNAAIPVPAPIRFAREASRTGKPFRTDSLAACFGPRAVIELDGKSTCAPVVVHCFHSSRTIADTTCRTWLAVPGSSDSVLNASTPCDRNRR